MHYAFISSASFHFNKSMSDDDVPKQKYNYADLSTIDPTNPESKRANLYALIVDASFPYPIENQGKYMVILKIIDPSTTNYAKVSIFSKDINTLPRIHFHGSILRIHRAFANIYKESLQFNCELPRSSWAIFKGEADPSLMNQYTPIIHSGKDCSLEDTDFKMINKLREFSQRLLSEKTIEKDNCILLKDAISQSKDFDVICGAYEFKCKGDCYILKVCDSTKFYRVLLKEGQAKSITLCSGDVIKLRGVQWKDANTIVTNNFSNILVLASYSKSKREFIEGMKNPSKEVGLQLLTHSIIDSPKTITKIVDPQIQGMNVKSLKLSDSGEKLMKFIGFAIDIQPAEVSEWVVKYNVKSKEISQLCPTSKLMGNEIYAYRVQFLMKDDECSMDDRLYRVFLFTGDGLGKEMLPAAVNLMAVEHKDKLSELKKLKKLMMSFNAYMELGVTSCSGGMLMITGTEMQL